jgi:hypothetical protein
MPHSCQYSARNVDETEHVRGVLPLELLRCQRFKETELAVPGIVEEDVDATVAVSRIPNCRLGLRGLGDVELQLQYPPGCAFTTERFFNASGLSSGGDDLLASVERCSRDLLDYARPASVITHVLLICVLLFQMDR